jgi:hypothetical protein
MFTIQLFILDNDGSHKRVDMFKDESVSITQTIQNVKDISKVFTDFTKTFNLPASSTNNKLFKHYYNSDIVNADNTLISDFDARKRRDAIIELNHMPFKKGKIRLDGVDMKNNKPYTYKVTFFGDTVNLSTLLGDDDLSNLDTELEDYDQTYSTTQLRNKLVSSISDVIVPLITHTRRLIYDASDPSAYNGSTNLDPEASTTLGKKIDNVHYNASGLQGLLLTELKYALRVHKIIEAIESKYTTETSRLKFSDDFFNTTNEPYYNLFLWLHRKKGGIEDPVSLPSYSEFVEFGLDTTMTNVSAQGQNITVTGHTLDSKLVTTLTVRPNSGFAGTYNVLVTKDGNDFASGSATNSDLILDMNLSNGTYKVLITVSEQFTFGESGVENAVDWEFSDLLVPESHTFDVSEFDIDAIFEFIISREIPEMKVIDFLTGIFKIFNLTAYVEDDGTIKVQTLDDFYSTGLEYDITDYVDITKSQINTSLPYKQIDFRFEGRETFFAATHEQLFNKEWGTIKYKDGQKLDGSTFNLSVPFEHMKFEKLYDLNDSSGATPTDIQWGWCADDSQDPFIGKPILFYPIRITGGDSLGMRTSTANVAGSTSYIIPANTTDLSSDAQTLNFESELDEYNNIELENTLFETYYKTYISDVFDSKNRLTKISAFLPAKLLIKLTLADRLIINEKKYKINSITTNMKNGKSEIELLNDF